jgi:predicted nucleic acid-binding protein
LTEYLLDTNVLVGWLNGQPSAMELLQRLSQTEDLIGVNAISVSETFSGLRERDVPAAERLFAAFDFWIIEWFVARMAGELRYSYARRGRTLSVTDTLLAAHAISRDAILVTANVRDFPMPELKILRYDQ